jgi:hypothetical protein
MKFILKMAILCTLSAPLCLLSSCQTPEKTAATAVCDCAEPMLALSRESKNADPAHARQALEEFNAAAFDFEQCMAALEKKYGSNVSSPAFRQQMEAEIAKQCPELSEFTQKGQ